MTVRLSVGHLRVLRPSQQALLADLIDQAKEVQVPFDQHGTGALIAAILGRPLPQLGALVFGHGVEPIPALLAAGQDISGVRRTSSATAVGLAAFAAEQIEGALDHGLGALEMAQGGTQGSIGAPESLSQPRQVVGQSASLILLADTDCKWKMDEK